ncbi:MAG: PSD1 domain-containing protein [Pirellulales bacterium]|nr:PSD1 domain-containing protein [Pirellulales bacterium]
MRSLTSLAPAVLSSALALLPLCYQPCPSAAETTDGATSFTHDIRPILAANCFACHGPDDAAREADLRLDLRESALAQGVIVPGQAGASPLVERITSSDPNLVMPPPDSGHRLSPVQQRTLQTWVEQGAEYAAHWSFSPPMRPALPAVRSADWPVNGIDCFILARLEQAGLATSEQADPYALVRRVYLDLTGLPPTPELADEFASSPTLPAYERIVDELLASPHFGEHWARVWLDLARYADTKGYEKDFPRDIWPYRDWVIRAINADMPYDQFTIEQLAGDLLPQSTADQQIATAFHRNTMNNDEGGTDDEEFRVAAVKDRVDTTMQVWMGLTAGCAKCHAHKFDPISQEEYYQLFAIFNQTADADRFDDAPVIRLETIEQQQQLKELRRQLADLGKKTSATRPTALAAPGGSSPAAEATERRPAENAAESALKKSLEELEGRVAKLPIMRQLDVAQQRTTHIHLRGNFLDPGAEVQPEAPSAFGRLGDAAPHDRLALARWIMANDNPLTARVAANRMWARLFGVGLVETEGDFGLQGAPPSHQLLLDWLAIEFRDADEWSLKKLCKTIVMSSTYRQSSTCTAEQRAVDGRNRLLGRGPRFRLPAETVRDQALAAAGLLSRTMFGPPVMPPQPPGVWKSIYNSRKWETSEGPDRYRRALYTYWKRTSPYPPMVIFDAESREVCAIRRLPTNTPLQALVLMNDPAYLEAAAALAKRMAIEGGATDSSRLTRGFRLLLVRPPADDEVRRLEQVRSAAAAKFAAHPEDALQLLRQCRADAEVPPDLQPHEFASYVVAASVLLNLDEAITLN